MRPLRNLERSFVRIVFITVSHANIIIYVALIWVGIITALSFRNPWLLLISYYLAPVARFWSFRSFSLGIFDFTFNTKDGGLHMSGGHWIYALMAPWVIYSTYKENWYPIKEKEED